MSGLTGKPVKSMKRRLTARIAGHHDWLYRFKREHYVKISYSTAVIVVPRFFFLLVIRTPVFLLRLFLRVIPAPVGSSFRLQRQLQSYQYIRCLITQIVSLRR